MMICAWVAMTLARADVAQAVDTAAGQVKEAQYDQALAEIAEAKRKLQ